MHSATALSAVLAALAVGQVSAMEEKISVSDVTIRRVKSSDGDKISSLSFVLSGANANGQDCSAENVSWPEPEDISACGNTDYAFLLFPGEDGHEYGMMVYHDVGDSHADLRGWIDLDPECVKDNAESGEETCTVKGPLYKIIDGPVGDSPGGGPGDEI